MSRRPNFNLATVAMAVMSMLAWTAAAAERTSPFSRQTVTLEAGAFLSDFDTRLTLSGPEGGTEIALEDDLNLKDDQAAFRANLAWRFANRHTLGIGYYSFNRSDTGVIEESFVVDTEDQTLEFVGSAVVQSRFDWDLIPVTYAYSFILTNRLETSASVGLHWASTTVGFAGEAFVDGSSVAQGASESESVSAPLPVFGLSLNYALTPRWFVGTHFQYFGLDYEDISGDLVDLRIKTTYWFGERFGAGVGYTWYDIDLDADDGAYQFKFDYRYNGLEAFLNFRF